MKITHNNFTPFTIEQFYLLYHLLLFNPSEIHLKHHLHCSILMYTCKQFLQENYFFKFPAALNNKQINFFNNWNISLKLKYGEIAPIIYANKCGTTRQKFFNTQMFKLFFLFNYSVADTHFPAHHIYKLFHVQILQRDLIIIDAKKIFSRWRDGLELLYNAFYYDFHSLVFSSPFFKNETLAINWYTNAFEINLWRYYFPFFVFQLHKYNNKSGVFFEKLATLDINFFIVVDCFYQYKTLFYIKKKSYYSVGLISINVNPWIIAYPIIGFFENLTLQIFFFKLIIILQKRALFSRFMQKKQLWWQFLFTKKIYSICEK